MAGRDEFGNVQWKRRAQRAEERQAVNEYDREAALQRLRAARAKSTITEEEALAVLNELEHWVVPPDAVSEAAIARGYEIARRDGLATYDPRGRVTVICGRCGQPALSEATPTILAHYAEAHGAAPRQMVLGRFEERCEVMPR